MATPDESPFKCENVGRAHQRSVLRIISLGVWIDKRDPHANREFLAASRFQASCFRRHRAILAVSCFFLVGGCSRLDMGGATAARELRIVLSLESPGSVELGFVEENSQESVVFRFRNEGEAPVVVARIKTDCPCVTAALNRYLLAPGEVAELRVDLDTTGFERIFHTRIALYSNQDDQLASFCVRGRTGISPRLFIDPPVAIIDELGATRELKLVLLRAEGDGPPSLHGLTAVDTLVGSVNADGKPQVTVTPEGNERWSWPLVLHARGEVAIGILQLQCWIDGVRFDAAVKLSRAGSVQCVSTLEGG